MLILTQSGERNTHLTGRGRIILLVLVLIPKALNELPTRQVKSLITKIALKTLILS